MTVARAAMMTTPVTSFTFWVSTFVVLLSAGATGVTGVTGCRCVGSSHWSARLHASRWRERSDSGIGVAGPIWAFGARLRWSTPVVPGWINYDGRFYKSELMNFLGQQINLFLVK
ncbi:hypothetical protein PSA01_65130 [Pseudonocardia saturnea]|uniref:Secreted protein n=1 Tax=Pseudonocardia saturnea TaxID=33909 RepID=A0ABQ0SA50_9PSEU|nr:hypothetical protein Pdca_69000 [Pseudonocardia autotrophica]GEC29484.1 hypothetical protein PSA01_65130 [Pseudonocardia saturnea]